MCSFNRRLSLVLSSIGIETISHTTRTGERIFRSYSLTPTTLTLVTHNEHAYCTFRCQSSSCSETGHFKNIVSQAPEGISVAEEVTAGGELTDCRDQVALHSEHKQLNNQDSYPMYLLQLKPLANRRAQWSKDTRYDMESTETLYSELGRFTACFYYRYGGICLVKFNLAITVGEVEFRKATRAFRIG